MLVQLPDYWLDRHHADTYIIIKVVCPSTAPAATGRCTPGCCHAAVTVCKCSCSPGIIQHVLARLPCHRVLLSAASSYFAACLGPVWGEGVTSAPKTLSIVLADVDDLPAMVAMVKCLYINDIQLDASDLAAVWSDNTEYLGTVATEQPTAAPTNAAGIAKAASLMCPCSTLFQDMQANFSSACWQELTVRVLRLADQFSVPGVVQAAIGKLSCLFSYQLSWPTVLAVLWLPASLAQQPGLNELRQMAINRVAQDMKHLDPCLSSPLGRNILQHLPPDAFAMLLASDQLALASENSTLTAIDVWLAGPVAHSLSMQSNNQNSSSTSQDCSSISCSSAARDSTGPSDAHASHASPGSSLGSNVGNSSSSRLTGALQLLMQQVRLPLCSGAFLSAALAQKPWLCAGLQAANQDLQWMRMFFSATIQGRYDLAMQLIHAGQRCPWSVRLRKGLPATFNVNTSSIHKADIGTNSISNSSNSNSSNNSGTNSKSASNSTLPCGNGVATYTGLSTIRGLLTGSIRHSTPNTRTSGPAHTNGLQAADRTQSVMADSCSHQHVLQQHKRLGSSSSISSVISAMQQQEGWWGAGAATALDRRVVGGYLWDMHLVAVDLTKREEDPGNLALADTVTDVCQQLNRGGAVYSCADTNGTTCVVGNKQLCLAVTCWPAWADVLEQDAFSQIAAPEAGAAVAATAVSATQVVLPGCCSYAEGGFAAQCCSSCEALWIVASAKAVESVARHAPAASLHDVSSAASCELRLSQYASEGAIDIVDIELEIGSDASSDSSNSTETAMEVCGPCQSQDAKLSLKQKVYPTPGQLDVVVGIQLAAAASKEHLQQLVGDSRVAGQQAVAPAARHMPCLLKWNAKLDCARGLWPVNIGAIGVDSNVLAKGTAASGLNAGVAAVVGAGNTGTVSGTARGILQGWQPELWSGLAPCGALYWCASIRPLSD